MARYRAGIVGLTGIAAGLPGKGLGPLVGAMPGSHAAGYAVLPQTEVVAYCDLQPELLTKFAQDWGGTWPAAKGYTDYRAMLQEAELDVLSVVTSDNRHADIVVAAAEAGVKGIFCEKPLATTLEDADRMIAAVEARGVVMSIDHTRRWYPLYHAVRERIRRGDIGALHSVVATLGGPRAMLFRNGTHLIDTVHFLVESEAEWVFGALDPGFEDYGVYRGDGGRDAATDPGGSGFVQFKNGVRAFINASKGGPQKFAFTLIGHEGRIEVTDTGATLHRGPDQGGAPVRVSDYRLTGIAAGIEELIRVVESGGELVSPPREARKTLEVLLAILRSHVSGNARVDLPLG